jgi:hypothetical protein
VNDYPSEFRDLLERGEPRFAAVLERLQENPEKYLGLNGPVGWEILKYIPRPGARILRMRFTGGADSRVVYVKISKNLRSDPVTLGKARAKMRIDYEMQVKLTEQLKNHPGFDVLQPAAYFDDLYAVVTFESAGSNFHELIIEKASIFKSKEYHPWLKDAARRSGEWLRIFQQTGDGENKTYIQYQNIRDYVDIRLQKLVASGFREFTEGWRGQVLGYFDSMSENYAKQPMEEVLVHGDYCPVNVLVTDTDLVVLDFPMARIGPVFQDVARFYTQLETMKYKRIYPLKLIREMQSAFLTGYKENFSTDDFRLKMMIVQHIVTHLWGRVKIQDRHLAGRLFNHWVRQQQLRELAEITGE